MEFLTNGPVDPGVILPFLAAVVLIELTPGPNMGWLALVSLSQGRTAGLAAVAGITLGLTLWMLAGAFGLTAIALARPALPQALTLGGMHVAVSVAIHGLIVVTAARVSRLGAVNQGAGGRALMAGGLVLIAPWTAWETRR